MTDPTSTRLRSVKALFTKRRAERRAGRAERAQRKAAANARYQDHIHGTDEWKNPGRGGGGV